MTLQALLRDMLPIFPEKYKQNPWIPNSNPYKLYGPLRFWSVEKRTIPSSQRIKCMLIFSRESSLDE